MRQHSHHIGKISLEIDSASLPAALRLRARTEELAWQRLPALIESILDALAPAGVQVRIARINLQLDDIVAERLEQDLPVALERALRSALADAIDQATRQPGEAARALSLPAAELDDFDTYLRSGAIPLRSAGQAYDAAAVLARLIDQQPAALAALLRRRAGDVNAIERLVLQAGEAHLAALLNILSPAEAAVVLAYLADFRRYHVDAAAVRLSEPDLGHSLWIVTLKYLLHEAGTQFNRRRYLAALLASVAAAEGLSYATLLALMQSVASRTRRHQPLAGSLLSTLDELLDELGTAAPESGAQQQPAEPPDLLAQLRAAAAHPVAIGLLLRPMSAPQFDGVIGQLQPQHAGLILAYLGDLTLLHQQRPRLGMDAAAFTHEVRLIALRHLLQEAGSQFNRLSWLRRLLQGLALRAGISYRALLAVFAEALAGLRERLPLSSSLPEGVAQLSAELHAGGERVAGMLAEVQGMGGDHQALAAYLRGCTPAQFRAVLRHCVPAHAEAIAADLAQLARLIAGWRKAPSSLRQWALEPLALRAVLDGAGEPFERRAWLRRLLEALADAAGLPASSLLAAIAAQAGRSEAVDSGLTAALSALAAAAPALPSAPASAAAIHAEAAIALAERYLRSGQPEQGGAQLSVLAAANPRGFATLLRRLLAAASGNTQVLTARLLQWMLPEEIVASLLPGQAPQAARWAQALADQPGGSMASAWHLVLDAAWRDIPLGGDGDAAWPAHGHAAMLRHWLDHGALLPPGWADAAIHIDGLLAWLSGATGASAPDALAQRHLARLLLEGDSALEAALRIGLASPAARQRWLEVLPEALQAGILHRLAPSLATFLLDLKTVLSAAWQSTGAAKHTRPGQLLWQEIWRLLAAPTPPTQRQAAAAMLGKLPSSPAQTAQLLQQARRLASQGGHVHLAPVLQRPAAAMPPPQPPAPRPAAAAGDGDILYVGSAGLVLAHVFLPMLFQKLGLLSKGEDERIGIHGAADASRAVHLLQYLVDGRCDATEPELALNKLLCGLEPEAPVAAAIQPSAEDEQTCLQLLAAVIGNWHSIGNTSAAGLRETFLQREGRLQRRDGKWTLTVERKTVDVLVDQIEWGYAVILQPWMRQELNVIW